MKSPCLPGVYLISSVKSMLRIAERTAQIVLLVLRTEKKRLAGHSFFKFIFYITPALLHLRKCLCSTSSLSESPSVPLIGPPATATIQTGGSFSTGVQLVEEPSAPLRRYFVLLDKLGHSGLPSHGFQPFFFVRGA